MLLLVRILPIHRASPLLRTVRRQVLTLQCLRVPAAIRVEPPRNALGLRLHAQPYEMAVKALSFPILLPQPSPNLLWARFLNEQGTGPTLSATWSPRHPAAAANPILPIVQLSPTPLPTVVKLKLHKV